MQTAESMRKEMSEIKSRIADGTSSLDDKFRLAWLEDALEREAIRAQRIKEASNLGKRFSSRTFDTFKADRDPRAYEQCLAYAEQDGFDKERNSLMIIGAYGTGKTHLAAAIANRLIDKGTPVLFDTFTNHLNKLKAEFDTGERKYLRQMKEIPMLILDDVGKEKQTDWTRSVMFDVINFRYEHMTPIVITSNLSTKQLEDYLGGACFSRMCEMCKGVQTTGSDYRRQQI